MEVAKYVDVMIGNEEDFTACLGLKVEGNDSELKELTKEKLLPADTERLVHEMYALAHRDFQKLDANGDDDFSFARILLANVGHVTCSIVWPVVGSEADADDTRLPHFVSIVADTLYAGGDVRVSQFFTQSAKTPKPQSFTSSETSTSSIPNRRSGLSEP